MELYYKDSNTTLYSGDMNDVNNVVMDNSIDCIITDPPYELGFMGKSWDSSGIAFQKETWKHCFDVLKPGGHLLAFGGSRTFHRIACAIEDAGFEIRDTIMWVYGSGFPKSMNIGLAIDKKNGVESKVVGIKEHCKKDFKENNLYAQDEANKNNTKCFGYGTEILKEAQNEWKGWGTQLKPAYEPIIVARKPFNGSLVDNVMTHGVGGLNIDECRVEPTGEKLGRNNHVNTFGGYSLHSSKTPGIDQSSKEDNGRFPANLILTYDETDKEEVIGGFPETKSTGGSGELSVKGGLSGKVYQGGWSHDKAGSHIEGIGDEGSASRYFYCAKASRRDRDEGLEGFEIKQYHNCHPTVKPTSLMQYLIRLVAPKGATILDPFMGSGSTGKALMYENNDRGADYKFIGVELTDEYLPIAKARILYAKGDKEKLENCSINLQNKLEKCENNHENPIEKCERFDFGA